MRKLMLAAAAALSIASPAAAATLYDSGEPLFATSIGDSLYLGALMRFGSDVTITGIDAAFTGDVLGRNGTIVFAIHAADHGVPGATLYSQAVAIDVGLLAWRSLSGLDWALEQGNYFFTWEPAAGSAFAMGTDTPNPVNRYAVANNGGAWESRVGQSFAFRVYGDGGAPVSFPLGGVPEPGTWALTIAGFGLAGASLRRRRRAATA